jgi:hypothetical protein
MDMLEKKKVKKPLPPEAEDDGPPTGPDGKPIKPRPFKKGGKVKCMARGGGCEVRGKTKGKMV